MLIPVSMIRKKANSRTKLDKFWTDIRSGNKKGLSELYGLAYPWLFKYGYQVVPQESFVEDAIHDLFLILWKKRNTIGKARSVKSYLCTALRRLIFRRLQKQRNRMQRNHDFHQTMPIEDHDYNREETIISSEVRQEQKAQLSIAMNSLTGRQKEAINLRFYRGFSTDEIAQIMDINKQSVYNHISNAISHLQSALDA